MTDLFALLNMTISVAYGTDVTLAERPIRLLRVDTAPDLSHAKVFVSVYGKQVEKDSTMEGLRAARPYLQRLISDELTLKRTPTLEFVYDATVDQGMRIQAILKSSGAGELRPEGEVVPPSAERESEG